VAWDVVLAFVLVIATNVLAAIGLLLAATALSRLDELASPLLVAVGWLPAALISAWVLRDWPTGNIHSVRALFAAAVMCGAAEYGIVHALAPWPDLLSDEVLREGSSLFFLEAVKGFLPWLGGVAMAFAVLRQDAPTAPREAH
jgi:hypothetical protein